MKSKRKQKEQEEEEEEEESFWRACLRKISLSLRMASHASNSTHWCHSCSASVDVLTTEDGELKCLECSTTFVEALSTNQSHDELREYGTIEHTTPRRPFLRNRVQQRSRPIRIESTNLNAPLTSSMDFENSRNQRPENLLGSLLASLELISNRNFALFPNNNNPENNSDVIGDFVFGDMSNLFHQLMLNDPNRYGAPPAPKEAIENLPDIDIQQSDLVGNYECAVCKDIFFVGDKATKMPCAHFFHHGCLIPWLTQHNSCPVCRFKLAEVLEN